VADDITSYKLAHVIAITVKNIYKLECGRWVQRSRLII